MTFGALLREYIKPHWRAVLVLLAGSYLATLLAALGPVLMAPILELALGSGDLVAGAPRAVGDLSLRNLAAALFHWLGIAGVESRFRAIAVLCVAFFAVGFLKGWVDYGNYVLALWIRVRAAIAMQRALFGHLLHLPLAFFNRQRTGELVSRLDEDVRATVSGVEAVVITLLTTPVLVVVYGYLMVRTSPRLVLAALAAVALHYGVGRAIRGAIRRHTRDQFSTLAELAAHFQEAFLTIRVVKSLGAEAFERRRLDALLPTVMRVNVRFGAYKHAEEPARTVVNVMIEASLLLLAAWELLAGRLSPATFFLFLFVGRMVVAQVALLAGAYTQMQAILAASTRVTELFALRSDVRDGPDDVGDFREALVLRDVSFDYGGEPVLDGVNLEIRRGEVVALVGPSGGGKSTLADLVLRLYDPTAGTVQIDGRDLRSLRGERYRRLFGVVPQECLLFNASIRDNITYGRDGISDAEVVRAARVANAHDFIADLPEGYDTVVGDRGLRLSGGQRQRIAIARAVVGSPPILILDEATSALDTESERLVQDAIDRVIEGATSIVIAHRLSTVMHADRIVVIARGRIEAVGRHADLLARSETYARLHRLQFADLEPVPESAASPERR